MTGFTLRLAKLTCMLVVAERKAHPVEKKDLLNLMLEGKDPKTGQQLSDKAISNNASFFFR